MFSTLILIKFTLIKYIYKYYPTCILSSDFDITFLISSNPMLPMGLLFIISIAKAVKILLKYQLLLQQLQISTVTQCVYLLQCSLIILPTFWVQHTDRPLQDRTFKWTKDILSTSLKNIWKEKKCLAYARTSPAATSTRYSSAVPCMNLDEQNISTFVGNTFNGDVLSITTEE